MRIYKVGSVIRWHMGENKIQDLIVLHIDNKYKDDDELWILETMINPEHPPAYGYIGVNSQYIGLILE